MKTQVLASLVLAAALALSGCVTQPERISATASGKPEVTIPGVELPAVKAHLIGMLVNFGYTLERDTEYSLVLTRPTQAGENFAVAMSIGNAYSSNSRVANFTFVKTPEGIRVIATPALRAQMPGGQVNELPLNGNGTVYNTFQQDLNEMKAKLAPTPAAAPPAAATQRGPESKS